MPLLRSGESPPPWCELEHFDIVELDRDGVATLPRRGASERLMVAGGNAQAVFGRSSQVLREGQFVDMPPNAGSWEVRSVGGPARILRFAGRWGAELGGCGLFSVAVDGPRYAEGDPVTYPKTTNFDSHYHDCDEYWIILEGTGAVVVGQDHFRVKPGDCIAIGMGHHHDFPEVDGAAKAAYFETTLEGRKRVGHLWNHTHGLATPRPERI